ncbi:hypothetical protein FXO38_22764 [Capsicum annuum]|nr:hypothetical protein FXO38_22764 [Capsicum annuum]
MEIRQKKEEVKAKHTTHNGVPAVMFNASDYYGDPQVLQKLGHAIANCRVLERKRAIEQQKLEEQNREKDNAEHTNGERQNEQGRTPKTDNIDNDDENNLEKHERKKDASNKVEREKKDNLTTISERINKDKKKEKKKKLPKKKSKVSFKPNIVQQIGKRTKKNQLKAASKVKALEEAIKTPINSNDNREDDLNRNNNEEVGQTLLEPFLGLNKVDKYMKYFGYQHSLTNLNGQIWLFWNRNYNTSTIDNTEQQITIKMHNPNIGKDIYITTVSAKCTSVESKILWDDLERVHQLIQGPWCVSGDFNVILDPEEKIGGIPH